MFLRLLIWLLPFTALLLASCSENPSSPQINAQQALWNQVASANCDYLDYSANAVPVDCYDWGKTPWPGGELDEAYTGIQGWLHAATIDPQLTPTATAKIEIDYIALIEIDRQTRKQRVVDVVSYDQEAVRPLTTYEGGLFPRWYHSNEFSALSTSLIKNGLLEVKPAMHPDKICHWWMNSNGKYTRKPSCLYQIKCRIKITGPVAVQLAADLYKTPNSDWPDNKEAFHSAWYGDTGGQFKNICYPDNL